MAKKKAAAKKTASEEEKVAKDTCFVIIPFRDPFDLYWRTIYKPAIEESNMIPVRGDSLFTPTPIMEDVWKMVQSAKVIVAEMTGMNANVFYEMGLAHAIGKPVILVSETMEDVPFDLRGNRVINYSKDDPKWGDILLAKVKQAIDVVLKDPAMAVPSMYLDVVENQAPDVDELTKRVASLEEKMVIENGSLKSSTFTVPLDLRIVRKSVGQMYIARGRSGVRDYLSGIVKAFAIDELELENILLQTELSSVEIKWLMHELRDCFMEDSE